MISTLVFISNFLMASVIDDILIYNFITAGIINLYIYLQSAYRWYYQFIYYFYNLDTDVVCIPKKDLSRHSNNILNHFVFIRCREMRIKT